MKTNVSLCAALAASFIIGSAAPTFAAPPIANAPVASSSDVTQIQERRYHRRDRFERRGDRAYYNGHRGYRHWRRGYRRHNGWWFPPAAFALGVIVGGTLNNSGVRYSNAHVRWCYDRWRSYRASDNTYQPYNGPRRRCVSPYS